MAENDREPGQAMEQAQLRSLARSIAGVEWLLLTLVVLYVFVIRPDAARDLLFVGVLVAFAVSLLVLRFIPGLRAHAQRRLSIQILIMIAFLTVILGQLGEISGGLLNLYLLPIVAAALALGPAGTIWTTLLVSLSYLVLATADEGLTAISPIVVTEAVTVLAPFLLVAFLTSRLADVIEASNRRVRSLSDRDWLTELLNIGAFMPAAERAHREIAGKSQTYSVILVDVDRLKQINDTYGYEAGNKAIRTVAEALLRVTGSRDLVARFGGEEFVAFLPNKEISEATELAQKLRNLVYASTFEVNIDIVRVQASVGVANYPIDGDSLARVMAAADQAMYKDKQLRARPEGQLVIQKR